MWVVDVDTHFSIMWSIWKARNDKISRDLLVDMDGLVSMTGLRLARWLVVRKEFSNVKIDDVIHNCGACMRCGLIKNRIVAISNPPSIGSLKLNIGGATWGKPSIVGIGSVLRNYRVMFYLSS